MCRKVTCRTCQKANWKGCTSKWYSRAYQKINDAAVKSQILVVSFLGFLANRCVELLTTDANICFYAGLI